MRLRYDEDTERFRASLREWLRANLPSDAERRAEPAAGAGAIPAWARAWQRRLFDAGWLVPGWPPERGGCDADVLQQLVHAEEMARLDVPRTADPQGLSIVAPSILDFGSAEQRERYVLPTLRAEISWCLGMSEPGAGSDLASLSTRAEVHPDRFVVTGQKIWTSGAHCADYCLCFVRSDPDAPRHRGISVVIVDMASPGIEVRPLPDLLGPDHVEFNEVFFDRVDVPRENLVGELHRGWSVGTGSLSHERGMMWLIQYATLERMLERLAALGGAGAPGGGPRGRDAVLRDRYASLYVDLQALRFMGYRSSGKLARGEAAPEESVLKLHASELTQRAAQIGLDAQGSEGLAVGHDGLGPRPWALEYLESFSGKIAGGTSEIQRNIIAQRVLGLPRR